MLLATSPQLVRRDRSGLSGQQAVGCQTVNQTQTCGYWGSGPAPAFYTANATLAAQSGYSIPINSSPCLGGACVLCVNPDGTVTNIFNWQSYPPTPSILASNPADPSFVPPPQSVWNSYLVSLGVQTIAQQQAAAAAAAAAYAQGASGSSMPGVLPSSYGNTASSGIQSTAPNVSVSGPGGRLTLIASRGGGVAFQPGDSWTITISGAAPSTPVTAYGVHPDGSTGTNTMGSTDTTGKFTLSGTFSSSDLGTWDETWYVGGASVGEFKFVVQTAGLPLPTSGGSSGSGTSTTSTSAGACDANSISLLGYCIPGWAAALGVVGLLFLGGKR
jgi:hypothetical protein